MTAHDSGPAAGIDAPQYSSRQVLIAGGIITGLMVALLAGVGLTILTITARSGAEVSSRPAAIQQLAQEILAIDIPAGMQPSDGVNLDSLGVTTRVARFTDVAGGQLIVAESSADYAPGTSIRLRHRGQVFPGFKLPAPEFLEVKLRGAVCEFEAGRGRYDDGREVVAVSGHFPTRSGRLGFILYERHPDRMSVPQAAEFIRGLAARNTADQTP